MKTIDALNAEMTVEIEARCRLADKTILKGLVSNNELAAFHRQIVVNEKFMELWEIVNVLDIYLQEPAMDDEARKTLRTMIDKL